MKKDFLVVNAGIDTLELEFQGNIINKENESVIDKYSRINTKGNTILVCKPSIIKNNGVALTTVKQTLEAVTSLECCLDQGKGVIRRLDIAIDSLDKIEDNRALTRMFLECLNLERRKESSKDIFRTIKGIGKTGNIKIQSKRIQTTIYNCEDKERVGNTRIENRILDIRSSENNKKIIEKEIKEYSEELGNIKKDIDKFVERVEQKYIAELHREYIENINKQFRTFTEFVAWSDREGYILTSDMLKGLMKKVGITSNVTTYAKNFRRLRTGSLDFTSKNDIKKLIVEMRKSLKNIMKN